MKLVVQLKSFRGHYKTNECLFWCFDARLTRFDEPEKSLFLKFIKTFGFKMPDVIMVAGGAMGLRDSNSPAFQYLLDQALKSWKLHGTKTFHTVIHIDCGAYKATGLFKEGDNERIFAFKEASVIRDNLEQGLRKNECRSRVKGYFADFDDGVWEIE